MVHLTADEARLLAQLVEQMAVPLRDAPLLLAILEKLTHPVTNEPVKPDTIHV